MVDRELELEELGDGVAAPCGAGGAQGLSARKKKKKKKLIYEAG